MNSSLFSTPATHQPQALLACPTLSALSSNHIFLFRPCPLPLGPSPSLQSPRFSPSPTGPRESFTPSADPVPPLLPALPGALSPQDKVPAPQPGLRGPTRSGPCWPPSLSPCQPLPSHLSPTTSLVLLPPAFPPAVPQTRRVTQPPLVSLGPASSEQQHFCSLFGLLVVRTVGGGGEEKVCVLFLCILLPGPLRAGLVWDTSLGLQHGLGMNVLNDTGDESIL